ncbi:hypothetical protein CJU89_5993 [Yarrowia sp. B02]|nr:hypothetical protein CJU89_5993 [Yarrowia sp. B02]
MPVGQVPQVPPIDARGSGSPQGLGQSPGQPGMAQSPAQPMSSPGQPVHLPGSGPSPSQPPQSPLAASNTPGRLVKDDQGILHYSQSFFSSVLQSATPVKSMEGEASGVPFFCKPGESDPSIPPTQLPLPRHVVTTLLTTYISDIHSVIRIVDLVQFHKDLTDYFADPSTATPGKMAMLYAMLFFAADVYIKLNEGAQGQEGGMEHSGLGKLRGMELSGSKAGSGGSSAVSTTTWVEWKNKLYAAATNTLVHSEYTLKPSFNSLRAHILLLYCSVGETLTRGAGLVELPILIRLAQSIGLHRDASNFPGMFTFAECEMRRRTWIYIQHLDSFYSRSFGLEPMVNDKMFDTRFPLLVDDEELHEGLYKDKYDAGTLHETSHVVYDGLYWPKIPEKMAWNDMCQSAIHTSTPVMFRRLYQRLVGCNPRDISRDLALLDHVRGFHERLFETTSHCDSRSRRTAFCMSRLVNSRCLIYLYTPYLSRKEKPCDLSSSPESRDSRDALREHIFTTSLLSLEYALEMTLSPYYVNQQWFSRKYTQVEHLLFLLTKLKLDPGWSQQKRAWQLACRTCEAYTKGYFADSSSKGWHACIKLRDIVSRTLGLEIDLGSEQWPLSVEYEGTRRKSSSSRDSLLASMQDFSSFKPKSSDGVESRESGLRSSLSFNGVKVEEEAPAVSSGEKSQEPSGGPATSEPATSGPATSGPATSGPTNSLDAANDKKVADSAFMAAMESASNPGHVSQPVTMETDMSFSLNPTDILDSNLFGAFPLGENSVRDDWTQELGGDLDWSEWDKMVHFIRGQ